MTLHGILLRRCDQELAADEETVCPRCGDIMIWLKSSWYCNRCRFKQGCCEGEV